MITALLLPPPHRCQGYSQLQPFARRRPRSMPDLQLTNQAQERMTRDLLGNNIRHRALKA